MERLMKEFDLKLNELKDMSKIAKQPRLTSAEALKQVKEGRKKDLEYEKFRHSKLKANDKTQTK
jgi:hypothetical protein